MPERHEMVLLGLAESGTGEEWFCPRCERRIVLSWPPRRFETAVLAEGDPRATHSGAVGGPAANGEAGGHGGVSEADLRWLRDHGIDWDGLAS